MFRIRTTQGLNFGLITEIDGQVFEACEIQFHTPGEHMMNGLQIDMEV